MPPARAYRPRATRACEEIVGRGGDDETGRAAGGTLRSRPAAANARATLAAAAARAAPRTPSRGSRKNGGSSAPAIAPAVLAAERAPPGRPTLPGPRARARTRTRRGPAL